MVLGPRGFPVALGFRGLRPSVGSICSVLAPGFQRARFFEVLLPLPVSYAPLREPAMRDI